MITALDPQTALVLIDLQNGIVKMPVAKPIDGVLKNAVKLMDAFHAKNLPVVIVHVNPSKMGASNIRKDAKPQQRGPIDESFLKIAPEIQSKMKEEDIIIEKFTWGAFYETKIHDELKKRNVTGIVLGGVSTSIGVDTTARGASERGYNIAFAEDAMTDSNEEAHAHTVKYIFPRIGETGSADDIIGQLNK